MNIAWDLDGVLLDSYDRVKQAYKQAFEEHGLTMPEFWWPNHCPIDIPDSVIARKHELYRPLYCDLILPNVAMFKRCGGTIVTCASLTSFLKVQEMLGAKKAIFQADKRNPQFWKEHDFDLVIDDDPRVCQAAVQAGVSALEYHHAKGSIQEA